MLWALLLSCTQPPPQVAGELIFVRDGVLIPGSVPRVVEQAWAPGQTVAIEGFSGTAPARPECVPLFHVPLSDVSRLAVSGGVAPNAHLAFSPDGHHLAVGSFAGDLVVVDAWTGHEIARTLLPEATTKRVAWSPDGQTVYAAEQSPDGFVHAMDPATLKPRWSFRTADHVQSSPLPPGEDRYAVYDMPAAYTLQPLASGDLLVVATHGWNGPGGARQNASQVFRLSPAGEILLRWPANPASATFLHTTVHETDDGGGMIAINMNRSAEGPDPEGLPLGGVQVLDLATLRPLSGHTLDPLSPWFKSTYLWQAIDAHPDHGVLIGMGDGRTVLQPHDPSAPPHFSLSTGAPIMAGDVPIAASVGFGQIRPGHVLYTTSDTNIPWGAASPELRPPTHHPGANGLFAVDLTGHPLWSWQGELRVQGLTVSPDGTWATLGGGVRESDVRSDLFGALVFDLQHPEDGRSGAARLVTNCATPNPVFFEHALTDDGRVAVVEYPYPDGKGGIEGTHRATVLR
jgi:WD40 repeat protein